MAGVIKANPQSVVLSGSKAKEVSSARAGYLPIVLNHVPAASFKGMGIYLRVRPEEGGFALYAGDHLEFSDRDRARLLEQGVQTVYIRIADQARFRRQVEDRLVEIATDPALVIAEKSSILYETSLELVDELLSERDLGAKSARLDRMARAVTTLVMSDPSAFSHLFAVSHHDFYTATHMVNVATWMVPLAYALGHRDPRELNLICQAGILHDMGKVNIPEDVLNKKGKLSDEDWSLIKRHPIWGCEYLAKFENIDPLIMAVTRQHHERMDGTGYPDGLKAKDIHPISRICAVVDSFDAMTAFRPFKDRTLSVQSAIDVLKRETPAKYDPEVLEAWLALLATGVQQQEEDAAAVVEGDAPKSAEDLVIKGGAAVAKAEAGFHIRAGSNSLSAGGGGVAADHRHDPDAHAASPASSTSHAPAAGVGASASAAASASASPRGEANQREHARAQFQCRARAHPLEAPAAGGRDVVERPAIPITTHNLSRGGLGFLSQVPIAPGQFLRVYLDIKSRGDSCDVLVGETVRCRAYTDGWYDIGLRFTPIETLTRPAKVA